MLENVKGLLTNDKGNTFKTILNVLTCDLNYKIYYTILDAKDFFAISFYIAGFAGILVLNKYFGALI